MSEVRGFIVRGVAAEALRDAMPGAVIAQLSRGLRLVPLTDAVLAGFEADDSAPDETSGLASAVLRSARAALGEAPLLYFEIDHGRQDQQRAVLWRGDRVVKGPTRINTALEAMGVQPDQGNDAMGSVGLRRFRDMASWQPGQSTARASEVRPRAPGPPSARRSSRGSGLGGLLRVVIPLALVAGAVAFVIDAGGIEPALTKLHDLIP